MKIRFTMSILVLWACLSASAQEIQTPSEGKSLVYFARISSAGALINFKFFDGEEYLGKFNGANYMLYECDPGEHIFWATSENRDFVAAELLPNKTYIIEVRPKVGAVKAGVKLFPLVSSDEKKMAKFSKLIGKKDPIELSSSEVQAEADGLEEVIKNGLDRYQKDLEAGAVKKLEKGMHHN